MKKLIFAAAMAVAFGAFADGDDNVAVLVSTTGPDRYLGGEVVMDGECYALVWSKDGVFEGFTADGAPIDANDRVVNVTLVSTSPDGKTVNVMAAAADGVEQPRVTRIVPEGDNMAIYVTGLKGYMRVRMGTTPALAGGVTPAVPTEATDEIKLIVPKTGSSGFYKVIRN